jgi:transposase-like protein
MLNIQNLIDDAKCYETVRALRWPAGVRCAPCDSEHITKQGWDTTQPQRQKYRCQRCGRYFDDLTGTVFAGHHQPLRTWILGLYRMGLNRSNLQIAHELGLNKDDGQRLTEQLRDGVVARQPEPCLSGEGRGRRSGRGGGPQRASRGRKKKGRQGRRRRLKGARGRGTLEKENPPLLGVLHRGGERVIRLRENVQQATISPILRALITPGTRGYTDEYDIYHRLPEWGFDHRTVCHGQGEYARDDDGDGFHEVPVNPAEGFWSLRRSWWRPHRGLSQEKLPL